MAVGVFFRSISRASTGERNDEIPKSEAEGATFAAAVLPKLRKCSANDAAIVYKNLKLGNAAPVDFVEVKLAFKRNYSCMGVTCEEVGGLNDGLKYFDKADPCGGPAWIPWSLHILAASTLMYTAEDPNEALDALLYLRMDIPDEEAVAKLQVEHALSNAFIRRKNWRMVLSSQQRTLDVLPAACLEHAQKMFGNDKANESATKTIEIAYRYEIMSRQGRIFLQLGAFLKEASAVFERASAIWKQNGSPDALSAEEVNNDSIVLHTPAQLAENEGLLYFSSTKHGEALEFFRRAVQYIRQSGSLAPAPLDDSSTLLPCTMGVSPAQALYSEAISNMAICALYTCRLREALVLTESLVREDLVKTRQAS